MGKRLLLVAFLLSAPIACQSTDEDHSSKMNGSSTVEAMPSATADPVEQALGRLGIDGSIRRYELSSPRIARTHLMRNLLLLETEGDEPLLTALERGSLTPAWSTKLAEPTKFEAAENDDILVLVSQHYAQVLDQDSGRRSLQFVRGPLAGLRRPFLRLPFTPTAGAAVGLDTFYVPSLGNPRSNKNFEAISAITGQIGWGYRTSGQILTTPRVGGGRGDPKLYFVTSSGLLTCMNATNYGRAPARAQWQALAETGVDQPLTVTEDTKESPGAVYIADKEGVVYSFNRITGQRNWIHATGTRPTAGPEVFGPILVVRTDEGLHVFDARNVVYEVHVLDGPMAGSVKWIRGYGQTALGGLTWQIRDESLVVTAGEGQTFAVDRADGYSNTAVVNGSVVAADGVRYRIVDRDTKPLWVSDAYDRIVARIGDRLVASKDGALVVLNAWKGEQVGEAVEIPGARLMPANYRTPNLYLVCGDATLYALYPR